MLWKSLSKTGEPSGGERLSAARTRRLHQILCSGHKKFIFSG